MKQQLAALVAALSLAACAVAPPSEYRPIVDTKDVDMTHYAQDVSECQQYAHQIDVQQTAANNAVAGAIALAALSALLGGHTHDNLAWAGAGALAGGLHGAGVAGMTQQAIIVRCMQGRGWRVLAGVPQKVRA
jgi:outer membrane lipoprotein SlyB